MNVQADRQALQMFLDHKMAGITQAPTGKSYVAADGTLWYEYTTADLDGATIWYTTRVSSALRSFTSARNEEEMEEAF